MSTMFVRLELSEKKIPLPKDGDVILNSMTQTREDLTFESYEDTVAFGSFIFIFLFRTKRTLA